MEMAMILPLFDTEAIILTIGMIRSDVMILPTAYLFPYS